MPWFEAEKRNAILRTPVGEFAAPAQTTIGMECVVAQSAERELANGGQITRGMALAHSAGVFTKRYIQYPVHGFHTPVSSCL